MLLMSLEFRLVLPSSGNWICLAHAVNHWEIPFVIHCPWKNARLIHTADTTVGHFYVYAAIWFFDYRQVRAWYHTSETEHRAWKIFCVFNVVVPKTNQRASASEFLFSMSLTTDIFISKNVALPHTWLEGVLAIFFSSLSTLYT